LSHRIRKDGNGAVIRYRSDQDANSVLGACLYIAQLNLGIEEAGMDVKRICEEVGCSSEELAKWSQLLKGSILPKRALKWNVPEGPGLSMPAATTTTVTTTPADTATPPQ